MRAQQRMKIERVLTAVVLTKDQAERDAIRIRLSHCGVLPICFKDEWICLENIHHIRPSFAVLRTDCYQRAFRFVNVVKAIKRMFPVIVLSKKRDVEGFVRNNWLANLYFLQYPADEKAFQGAITLLAAAKQTHGRPVLIGGSRARKKLIQDLPQLGMAREPLLIQGQRGVGKKLMGRAIHGCSAARRLPLDTMDARTLSGEWIREAGSGKDAAGRDRGRDRVWVIKNIENMSFSLQSQLLSVMDDWNGNGRGENTDRLLLPLITLAGCNLEALALKGGFRKDLYFRLSVLKVTVPPLRGHVKDICAMAEHFTTHYSIRFHNGICRLPKAVLAAFADYPWPGNVPELKRAVQQWLMSDNIDHPPYEAMGRNGRAGTLYKHPTGGSIDPHEVQAFWNRNRGISLKQAKTRFVMKVEKKMMKAALVKTGGNCKKAAGLLNISYKSMLNKAKAYRLA